MHTRHVTVFLAVGGLALALASTPPARGDLVQTNLVSDVSGLALVTDAKLVNPWGMSASGGSPFWVSDQATGVSTLYSPFAPGIKQALTVTIPTAGNGPPSGPTGQVFNTTASDFQIAAPGGATVKSLFLFATLDGTIQGWNPGSSSGGNAAAIATTVPRAVFTGLTLGVSGGANFLFAADTANNRIDVFDNKFNNVTATTFAGKFVDPNPVPGFSVYNVQTINGTVYVTYASVARGVPSPGGYVDKYDQSGNFLGRVATGGPINAPWGLAIAPSGFAPFAGDLLVGNFGDSKINAFNLTTGQLDGTITVNTGFASPVGLWGLQFGNGVTGDPNTLYFTDGINNEHDGLFGQIQSVPEPSPMLLLAAGGLVLAAGRSLYGRVRRGGAGRAAA